MRRRFGHNYLSKHISNRIKLIRKLNNNFGWKLPEETKFYYIKGAGQKTEGWAFNFYFQYDGSIYGASECVTGLLKHKEYQLYNNGSNHIEICPVD